MELFELDEKNFITKYTGNVNDSILVVPDYVEGVRSFSFCSCGLKEIIFQSEDIIFEENAFIDMPNLQYIDVSNCRDYCMFMYLSSAFADCPNDICFFINSHFSCYDMAKHSNDKFGLYFRPIDLDINILDLYDYDTFDDKIILNHLKEEEEIVASPMVRTPDIIKDKMESSIVFNFFFPDYIDGKEVLLDLSTHNQRMAFNKLISSSDYVKLPRIIDASRSDPNTLGRLRKLSGVHLSRLDTSLSTNLMNSYEDLSWLYIPKNYEVIGGFQDCSELESIIFEDSSTVNKIRENCFINCKIEKDCWNSYKDYFSIDDLAFRYNHQKTKINIEKDIRIIADSFAIFSKSLKQVTFNEGLEIVGDRAFYAVLDLLEINLPSTLKEVKKEAFSYEILEDEQPLRRELSYPKGIVMGDHAFKERIMELPFR